MNGNALDSPLEVLAFNYLGYGVLTAVNNIWAWIGVVTAAIGFWKIKSSVSPKSDAFHPVLVLPEKEVSVSQPAAVGLAAEPEQQAFTTTAAASSTTRGKFFTVVYYGDEDESESVVDGESECGGWEAVLRMKTGELGWYRYQDLTVLDGNVVRLWDDYKRRNGVVVGERN